MTKNNLLILVCTLVLPCIVTAQEYSYSQYGITEGLAGSTVYCITQDKDGFIWAGTETGLSRFDGTHFKSFTTRDGLPDLEVLQLFSDSKGRVWMAPLCKSVCYYYQGSIHNQQNDTLLSRIHLQGNIEGFVEDPDGNILLKERNCLHILAPDGSLVEWDSLDHEPVSSILVVSRSASGHFLAQTSKKNITFSKAKCLQSKPFPLPACLNNGNITDKAMNPYSIMYADSSVVYKIRQFSTNKVIQLPLDKYHYNLNCLTLVDDSLAYINGLSGSFEYNIHTGQGRRYLPGISVSRIYRDRSGDLWFATLGQGLFRLVSSEWKTIRLTVEGGQPSTITTITRIGNELWLGDNHNYIFRYALPDLTFKQSMPHFYYLNARLLYIDTIGRNGLLTMGDYGLLEGTRDNHYIRQFLVAFKSAVRINSGELLIAGKWGAYIFDVHDFKLKDTLWRERATVAFNRNDTFYIGTLNGLYRAIRGQPVVFLGKEIPFLRKRISSIAAAADGTLWIASYDDAGIIGYKNNKQVVAITRQQGLTSDICRTLLVHDHMLWVGTDRGLNKVELNKPGYPVTQYTFKDGLASDMVNTLFADGSRMYVGTSAGLSFFDEQSKVPADECRIYFLSLMNALRERIADTANLVIPYSSRQLRIEYAGISYRSAGKILYRYRMAGIDSVWRETKDTYLEYPELPAGNYELELMAINKFGNQSRVLRLPITVTTQFYKKPWFVISAWVLSLALLWWAGAWRITRIRRKQQEKEILMHKMAALENTALTSQMNPHFIFNCLNSIQLFIFNGDIKTSNRYIAGLGRLIRMTLNNSSRSFVSLAEEADYLSSYLLLEKMRFEDKIDYELVIEKTIDPATVLLPPMLVQPFVENALHHGLQHKTSGKGLVSIKVQREKEHLMIIITDNGIGRKAAAIRKKTGLKGYLKEYTSKGVTLTEDRIEIMNKLYKRTTSVEISDVLDDKNAPIGTSVIVLLPFFQEQDLYS